MNLLGRIAFSCGFLKKPPVVKRKHDQRSSLLQLLPKHSTGAEIGVYRGAFSAQLLEVLDPRRLYLIDPWQYFSDEVYAKALYGGKAAGQVEMDAIHDEVVRTFGSHPAVAIIRAKSDEAVLQMDDNSLDWVYIDGNHLYEFVYQDLVDYSRKVKPGGLIAGDDYRGGGWWNGGVKRAVDEFVERGCAELVKIYGRQFLLRRNRF
jgi:hypothetical protein